MGDPELRSDEKVLVRTPGVYVKSIPFEGILTNKRIILIDRAKNLLPPKEIPLVTIKEAEPGENAIRDQVVTLSVMAKTGEIRQMILTFSRQAGGNRIKERDAWIRIIRENASSAYDQVIRKVIPGTEPAPRRSEPLAGPRYEIVHSSVQQPPLNQPPQPAHDQPVVAGPEEISPVRGAVPTAPVAAAPAPVPRQPGPATTVYCPKCGNRVPVESVFCNRCGAPLRQAAPVPAPVQPPAVPTPPAVVSPPSTRPIDQEIRSIEPLIERSAERAPADALRVTPIEPRVKHPLAWVDEEETSSPFEEPAAPDTPSAPVYTPELFTGRSQEPAAPAPIPSYGSAGDTPPPRPPGRSIMPGRQTMIRAAVALVVVFLVAAAAVFILPMLGSGGLPVPGSSGDGGATPTSSSSTVLKPGTIVAPKETVTAAIPPAGIFVHINYLGGFKGSYGATDFLTAVPGNSGDRVWEVENATNSTVTASFEKTDGSGHPILVEIYRDGVLLSKGSTTVGHGAVSLSVDMVTGKAKEPETSGVGSSTSTVTATIATPAPEQTPDASVYESGGTAAATTAPPATTAAP